MAWNQDLATQWGRSSGLLKGNEVATGGLLQQRANESGKAGDLQSIMKKVNSSGSLPGVKPLSVASFTDPQKTALTRMTKPSAPVDPRVNTVLDRAISSTGQAATPYDPNSYKQFMNPYLTDVVDTTADRIRRSFDDTRTQAREQIGAAGAFGSTALSDYYNRIGETEGRQIADTTANLMAGGFDTAQGRALGLYDTTSRNALNQASQYGNIANQVMGADAYGRGIELGDTERQLQAGGMIQGQNQAALDAFFAERDRQLNEPVRQAEILRNALVSYPTGQSSTQIIPGNPYLSALGGGMVGNRMFGGYSSSNLSPGQIAPGSLSGIAQSWNPSGIGTGGFRL